MAARVLFVDDEALLLETFRRILTAPQTRQQLPPCLVETALKPTDALAKLESGEQYALIISDLKMPEMSGVQLLEKAREIAPKTVRMMLTGYADLNTSLEAINRGSIFRFATKPCTPVALRALVAAGLEQHRLLMAEQELLADADPAAQFAAGG